MLKNSENLRLLARNRANINENQKIREKLFKLIDNQTT